MNRISNRLLVAAFLLVSFNICLGQKVVKFTLADFPNVEGAEYGLRGSSSPLDWNSSISLVEISGTKTTVLQFDDSVASVEFKFVIQSEDEKIRWEGTENRILNLPDDQDTIMSINKWEVEPYVDPSTLKLLSPSDLRKDYQLIREMILNVHPGTYRYNSKDEIMKSLKELELSFSDTLTHAEAFLAISKLLSSIQCDHTYASFYNQNSTIKSIIHGQPNKLPFAFKWIDGRMIITYSAIDELEKGLEVIAINGTSAFEIGRTMLPYLSADGATERSRWMKASISGFDFRFGGFDLFYPLLYPVKDQVNLSIFNLKDHTRSEINVPLMTLTDRSKALVRKNPEFPKTSDDLLDFDIQGDVGIMKLGSFAIFGWKKLTIDYKDFFKDVFDQVNANNLEHLIIDMRENEGGGDDMLRELLTYMDIERIVIDDREGKTRFTNFPETLKPYVQSWGDPWYYALEPERIDENGYFVFAKDAQVDQKNQRKPTYFKGNTYWLTSPKNVSLGYYTAAAVRRYKLGTIIGEETGGNLQGINGGQILFLRLPNSEIEIDFPVMGDFSIERKPNHGVKPDYEVVLKPEDINKGYDRAMEFAKQLVSESKE